MATRAQITEALRRVIDPELGVDIVAMGLIYDIRLNGSKVLIQMTMTSSLCPLEEHFRSAVTKALRDVSGITVVNIDFVFEPAWTAARIAPGIREQLGIPLSPQKT